MFRQQIVGLIVIVLSLVSMCITVKLCVFYTYSIYISHKDDASVVCPPSDAMNEFQQKLSNTHISETNPDHIAGLEDPEGKQAPKIKEKASSRFYFLFI